MLMKFMNTTIWLRDAASGRGGGAAAAGGEPQG
jgi:hypothetical protein